jgi:putative Mg2+ transporter-C (MgtC) family protein
MPLTLDWTEVAWRLVLTTVAGALLGLNRSAKGRTAGLRATILVCLAASVSMIVANLLLTLSGKASNSFIQLDLMRLPLGILTGMGFIGAGAIIRRHSLIQGVTTVATLWLATVPGLCFGTGLHWLGLAGLAIAPGVLWGLVPLEDQLRRQRRALVTLVSSADCPAPDELRAALEAGGYRVTCQAVSLSEGTAGARHRTFRWKVLWQGRPDSEPPAFLEQQALHPGVLALRWVTQPS